MFLSKNFDIFYPKILDFLILKNVKFQEDGKDKDFM